MPVEVLVRVLALVPVMALVPVEVLVLVLVLVLVPVLVPVVVLVEPQSRRAAGANELPRDLPQVLLRVQVMAPRSS
eukprot:SAG22_NODE_1443_length_4412_cov_46.750058_1_plen_75_part_10